MASRDDVIKLAALARLSVSEDELDKFSKEFESILAYVSQINELQIPEGVGDAHPPVRNVFRNDGEPDESGLYTEKIAAQFPAKEGDLLVVKKIISND